MKATTKNYAITGVLTSLIDYLGVNKFAEYCIEAINHKDDSKSCSSEELDRRQYLLKSMRLVVSRDVRIKNAEQGD